jgi:hypothetical protein
MNKYITIKKNLKKETKTMKKRYPTIAAAALVIGAGCYATNINPWHPTKAALEKVFIPPQFRSNPPVVVETVTVPTVKPVETPVVTDVPKPVVPVEEVTKVEPNPQVFDSQLHTPKKAVKKAKTTKKKLSKISKKKAVVKKCVLNKDGKLQLLR